MTSEKITVGKFKELLERRSQPLLELAGYLSSCDLDSDIFSRPLFGELLNQSVQIEEFLDAYEARNNCQWCVFRSLIAAFKLFSGVGYELVHIQHSLPTYHLLPIEEDFVQATRDCLRFTDAVILRTAKRMRGEAEKLELRLPVFSDRSELYSEELPVGRLPHDCKIKRKGTVAESVTLLATAFLNLSAESERVYVAGKAQPEEYESFVRSSVSEEKLRSLELRFHNLQSMYDTFVSGTELEEVDTDLVVLRGHISVVFHLLRTATSFAHYYERHLNEPICDIRSYQEPLVRSEALLDKLMSYSLNFVCEYLYCAVRLCQTMLKRYAEIGEIEVSVPSYRGFHVRPATLISKIVLHYGSEVSMKLEGERYDASSSLDLFRVNEQINARKRRWLGEEIVQLGIVPSDSSGKDVCKVIRGVVMTLAERGQVILYKQPIEIAEKYCDFEGSMLERVTAGISELLATGKIDIATNIKVRFVGDKRVLSDIKLLAESGYGEDRFGNNIALPEKLEYLGR